MIALQRLVWTLCVAAGVAAAAVAGTYPAAAAPKAGATASAAPSPEAAAPQEPAEKAIPRLEAKLKATPQDRDALRDIIPYYLQVNRPDRAYDAAQKLLQLGVKDGQTYYFSGYSALQLGKIPQATSDLEQAANLEPTNIVVLGTLTDLYINLKRPADAERVAKRALTFNKDDKRAYTTLGQVYEAQRKNEDARAQYEAAAKLDPKDAGPVILEARTYLNENAIALASSLYDRALQVDPKSVDALYGKARILASQHNVKEAIAMYESLRGVVAEPDAKATVIDEEARLYATEKMDGDAVTAYQRAISEFPAQLSPHVAYGDYLASKNNLAQAEKEWQTGLGPNRDNREALGRLGGYYADKKDLPKALEYLKRLAEITPGDPKAFAALGSIYASQRDWQRSHDSFRRVFDLTHAPDALVAVGESDLNMRNYKEAQQIFEVIDKNDQAYIKQDPRVLFLLGQTYEKNGRAKDARGAYTRFLAYLKPGTQAYTQVKKLITDIDRGGAKAPAPRK